jgi:hypothetical protein
MRNKLMTVLVIVSTAGVAVAQTPPASTSATATNTANPVITNAVPLLAPVNQAGSIGVGPMIGEPMGVTMKYWFSDKIAVDAGAGWSFADPDGFQLHGDFLYHAFNLIPVDQGQLALYFGGGARVKFVDEDNQDNHAGIRGPVGVSYLIPNTRLEAYAEVAPILDLAPDTRLDWDGGVGLRFYF